MQTIHYLAGANTAAGFFSCFDSILPPESRKRMYFLKGGPGVGKSTLMRRFAEAAAEKGLAVEYFHCSSDPDSLDGVALPQRGIGLMDATAPHSYDPVIPGARDTLLSLGDFLDEQALSAHTAQISRIMGDISARFSRCYRYLAGAKQMLSSSAALQGDRCTQLADSWMHSLPLRGGSGSIRRLFASAFTPRGLVTLMDFSVLDRRVTLETPFGACATPLMQDISRRAAGRGLDVVELLDPLCPDEIAHVLIPAHGIAFCTAQHEPEDGEWVEASTVFDLSEDREQSFDRNACELLCQRAVEQLHNAKVLHDQLEAFYVKNMDFLRWQHVLDRLLETL